MEECDNNEENKEKVFFSKFNFSFKFEIEFIWNLVNNMHNYLSTQSDFVSNCCIENISETENLNNEENNKIKFEVVSKFNLFLKIFENVKLKL